MTSTPLSREYYTWNIRYFLLITRMHAGKLGELDIISYNSKHTFDTTTLNQNSKYLFAALIHHSILQKDTKTTQENH